MAKADVAPEVDAVEVEIETVKPTQYRQVSLRVPTDLWDAVEAYRWDARIDKRGDAFVAVLALGVESLAGE